MRDNNPSARSQSPGQGAIDGLPLERNVLSSSLERPGNGEVLTGKNGMERPLRARASGEKTFAEDVAPVRMVHRANPSADIPSLYDMYVQASGRESTQERFGLKIFRNNSLEPDAIPTDLPVGPEYVVGPGDGLAINLWGGVSQRVFRIVDREGRITLPEAGPLLVSGRSLGDVQRT